jgi:hypothetical protein
MSSGRPSRLSSARSARHPAAIVTTVRVVPQFTDRDFASQHDALVDDLRASGFHVDLVLAADPDELHLPLTPWDLIVHVGGVIEDHILDVIVGAVLARLYGLAKRGPRKGKRRRLVIVDERNQPRIEIIISEAESEPGEREE